MHIEGHVSLTGHPKGEALESSSPAHLNAVQSAQRRLVAVVTELLALEHELHEISESLPIAEDQCAMEGEAITMDVALWLRMRVDEVRGRRLGQAIDQLREAAQRTEANQRYAFHEATRS